MWMTQITLRIAEEARVAAEAAAKAAEEEAAR